MTQSPRIRMPGRLWRHSYSEDVLFDDKAVYRRDHEVVDQLIIVHAQAAPHFDADDFSERGLANIIICGRRHLIPRGAGDQPLINFTTAMPSSK